MHLTIAHGSLQIAKEDIACYKIVDCHPSNPLIWRSAFTGSPSTYPFDKVLCEKGMSEETMRMLGYEKTPGYYQIHGGFFHASLDLSLLRRDMYRYSGTNECRYINVCKCTIPKGAEYYCGFNNQMLVVTTKIIVHQPDGKIGRVSVFAKKGSWKVMDKDVQTYTVAWLNTINEYHTRYSHNMDEMIKLPYVCVPYTRFGTWVGYGQMCNTNEPEYLTVEMPNGLLRMDDGFFHSASEKTCLKYMQDNEMIDNKKTKETIITCTIPKDTLYYMDERGWIASRKIVFHGMFGSVEFFN